MKIRAFLSFVFGSIAFLASLNASGIPEPDLIWYGSLPDGIVTTPPPAVQILATNATSRVTATASIITVNSNVFWVATLPTESLTAGSTAFLPDPSRFGLQKTPVAYSRSISVNGTNFAIGSASRFTLSQASRGTTERLDLSQGGNNSDPYVAWLTRWGLSNNIPSTAIVPGKTNAYGFDFAAGLNPRDPNSLFKIDIAIDGSGLSLVWASDVGRFYSLQRVEEISSGFSTSFVQHIPGSYPKATYRDQALTAGRNYFYRLTVE